MGKTMKAFVMKRIGEVGITENAVPEPGSNDAVVKTTTALICTSDTHTAAGAIGERTNLTLGHEAVGVIYKLGSAVAGFKKGDRVAVNAITPCYQCENGLRGFSSQCTHMLGGWRYPDDLRGLPARDAPRRHGLEHRLPRRRRLRPAPPPRLERRHGRPDHPPRALPRGRERMKRLIRLIKMGRVDPRPLTRHRFPFGEVEKAFRMMQTKEDGMLKPLILFDESTSRGGN
jgi:threonine dehydrogenase-like Zn-dependent dehydrogenase